ncbi:hypothetical protein WA026_009012 [Henosepilachna vigintioctopunctata]|uniref:Uncharacterized protein n=1 Tax=Henosepilachna vigintioctopunctata TaxID=420089 RepID=A0AAW1UMF0_9CUCU
MFSQEEFITYNVKQIRRDIKNVKLKMSKFLQHIDSFFLFKVPDKRLQLNSMSHFNCVESEKRIAVFAVKSRLTAENGIDETDDDWGWLLWQRRRIFVPKASQVLQVVQRQRRRRRRDLWTGQVHT